MSKKLNSALIKPYNLLPLSHASGQTWVQMCEWQSKWNNLMSCRGLLGGLPHEWLVHVGAQCFRIQPCYFVVIDLTGEHSVR